MAAVLYEQNSLLHPDSISDIEYYNCCDDLFEMDSSPNVPTTSGQHLQFKTEVNNFSAVHVPTKGWLDAQKVASVKTFSGLMAIYQPEAKAYIERHIEKLCNNRIAKQFAPFKLTAKYRTVTIRKYFKPIMRRSLYDTG